MNNINQPEVLFLTSYPPRECGIATYTIDLIKALSKTLGGNFVFSVCALENGYETRQYPEEVKYVLNTNKPDDYVWLAEEINQNVNIKMVFIQHEFGLFGGVYGETLLYFLYSLHKPIAVTFHTVLPQPDEKRKVIVKSIADLANVVMVMTNHAANVLKNEYALMENKIHVIPHGTHPLILKDKKALQIKYNTQNRLVMSSFGLISANKNIETALAALTDVVKRFPNVLYLIIGKTHPEVVKNEGEQYRELLEQKIQTYKLEKHVQFINRYVDLSELLELLQLSDIYLFTSKDKNQAVSGTFAYALSCGCPVVATAIPHAQELLSEDVGVLIDFQNPQQLSQAIMRLLDDEPLRKHLSVNALNKSKVSLWTNVAVKHVKMMQPFISKHAISFSTPAISLEHIRRLTDHIGMVQFAEMSTPDLTSGYTLDDNSRALIAMCMNFQHTSDLNNQLLIRKYLLFILNCQQENGFFFNYMNEHGEQDAQNQLVNLEDANGRAIWALGFLISLNDKLPKSIIYKAEQGFLKALKMVKKVQSPRAMAFCIKGLFHYNTITNSPYIAEIIGNMANVLAEKYHANKEANWEWYEPYLTYANSVLPEAMLYAHLSSGNPKFKIIAKESFDFLLSNTFTNEQIGVISNNGWLHKGKQHKKQAGGEQPIDIAYTIQTLKLFYEVFGEKDHYDKMEIAFSWFLGNNRLLQMVYNEQTGGCHDGIEKNNINLNQGAESTVCYLISILNMKMTRKANDLKVANIVRQGTQLRLNEKVPLKFSAE